jgi:hypothetical protein
MEGERGWIAPCFFVRIPQFQVPYNEKRKENGEHDERDGHAEDKSETLHGGA